MRCCALQLIQHRKQDNKQSKLAKLLSSLTIQAVIVDNYNDTTRGHVQWHNVGFGGLGGIFHLGALKTFSS